MMRIESMRSEVVERRVVRMGLVVDGGSEVK